MKIRNELTPLPRSAGPIVLAAGFFDGVHVGHQRVIRAALRRARAMHGRLWVMTFDPHPLQVLRPELAPPLLTDAGEKLRLLKSLGVDGCLVVPFNRRVADMTPDAFVRQLAAWAPVAEIWVGRNWRFGRRGAGTPAGLRKLGKSYGFHVRVVPAVKQGHALVSSTRIRQAVQSGDMAAARRLLGRPYTMAGRVLRGRGVGRALGYPTANIQPGAEVLPATGVYAVLGRAGRTWRPGVLNFGTRPTFGSAATPKPLVELHLLDFQGDLYGREMKIAFVARLRDERPFASPAHLQAQIREDVRRAQQVLRAKKFKESLYRQGWDYYAPPLTNIKKQKRKEEAGSR